MPFEIPEYVSFSTSIKLFLECFCKLVIKPTTVFSISNNKIRSILDKLAQATMQIIGSDAMHSLDRLGFELLLGVEISKLHC